MLANLGPSMCLCSGHDLHPARLRAGAALRRRAGRQRALRGPRARRGGRRLPAIEDRLRQPRAHAQPEGPAPERPLCERMKQSLHGIDGCVTNLHCRHERSTHNGPAVLRISLRCQVATCNTQCALLLRCSGQIGLYCLCRTLCSQKRINVPLALRATSGVMHCGGCHTPPTSKAPSRVATLRRRVAPSVLTAQQL